MKRRFSFPALVLLTLLSVLLLPGCGSSSRQVPDSVIERDTVDCDYDAGYSRSWTAVHDYDSSSQTDNVAITLTLSSDCGTMTCRRTVVYAYDKSSGQWSAVRRESWSDPEYAFGKGLCGTYPLTNGEEVYEVKITSVSGNSIRLECWADAVCQRGYFSAGTCYLEASGAYSANGRHLEIPLELPDGYYAKYRVGDTNTSGTDRVTLNLYLDIADGISTAFLYPTVGVS